VYSRGESELILGRALKEFGLGRDQAVIATKVFFAMGEGPNDYGLSRKHILQSVDDSLRRLGTDYIDLLQIHRFDDETPIEETLGALNDVVRAGKVRYVGASSMAAWRFAKMLYAADRIGAPRFVSMQNNYSLIYREEEREMNPLCLEEGVGLIPYAPLGGGVLAGSRKGNGTTRSNMAQSRSRFQRPEDEAVVDVTAEVATAHGVSPAQVAIAWLLSKPAVTAPIVGVTRPEQLADPLRALELRLDESDIERLEAAYVTQPVMIGMPPRSKPRLVRT
jgi:aryl-alcohol dehydrogenase-like predicted oxidoreductase